MRPDAVLHASFVGRSDELTRLHDLADLAVENGAQMVLLSGEAGIGKSTLTSQFLARLRDGGWGTHVGHCIEFADRPLPFGPVVTILRSLLLDNLEMVDDLVAGHRIDLATLVPELAGERELAGSLIGDVDRLFGAVAAVFKSASAIRPQAAVIEDIHWADAATRDLLASLVHSLGSARTLVIVTERSGAVERAHPLHTWLAERRRFPNVHSIELEGWTTTELREQAVDLLGESPDDRFLDELLVRSGGNPYFAHELLVAHRGGDASLPSSLVDFLTSRLQRLSRDEREVLRAIAVAGGFVPHNRLVAMTRDIDFQPAIRSLFDASVISTEGQSYTFDHALLREAILRDVLPFEAEDLHRRAAEAILETVTGSMPLGDAVGLAMHWHRASEPELSLLAAVEAAEGAAGVAAYDTAADLAIQALRAWGRVDDPEVKTGRSRVWMTLRAAEWLAACYRGSEAVEVLDEALRTWAHDLPAGTRAHLTASIAPVEFNLGNPKRAAALLDEARELVGDELSAEAAQVHHRISRHAVLDGQIHPALEAAERAIAIASEHGPGIVLIEALTTKALAIGVTQDRDRGIALAHEARALAAADRLVSQVAQTYRTEMLIVNFRDGRTQRCLDALVQGMAYADENCGPRWSADFRLDLALGYVEAGRLNDAAPLIEALLRSEVDDLRRLTVLQIAGLSALAAGTLEDAERHLASATEIADRYQSAQETGVQFRLLADLARRHGRLDEALAYIDRALELQLEHDNITYTRESIVEKIRVVGAHQRQGHPSSEALIAEVAALVDDFEGPGPANMAMGTLMRAEVAAISGAPHLDLATRAVEELEACGFAYDAAQARLLIIDHLIGQPRARERLEDEIKQLMEIARANGLRWIADAVRSCARIARIPLDPDADADVEQAPERAQLPHQLTQREVEVMSLLAEGMTNKAIGERLFVSPRTVSTHISNLLAKLGVTNRGEAAAAYRRLGLEAVVDLREGAHN